MGKTQTKPGSGTLAHRKPFTLVTCYETNIEPRVMYNNKEQVCSIVSFTPNGEKSDTFNTVHITANANIIISWAEYK